MKITYKFIWLLLSSFGIMFAVFSWIQDSQIFDENILLGYRKGIYALISGVVLYYIVARKI
ncbi:MAG: hypothetical protein CMP51_00445 [Flavobacteriales bacterium]|nr:hypothetical protein [Flavobacteriales bacterium]|tara:strand:- start:1756 stop:1938 length:183 start_codon:yes stop_codon:yes gene_type:complete